MVARCRLELLAPGVRELRVGHAQVGLARRSLDEPRIFEALEEASDAGRRQHQAPREFHSLQSPLLRSGEHEQRLVIVERQAMTL